MTGRQVVKLPQADTDLEEIAAFLETRSPHLGLRFLARAEETFLRLAGMPGLGMPRALRAPRLAGLRCSPISGFRKYLAYYRPIAGGIVVLRVLHGARDLNALLGPGDAPEA